MKPSVLAAIPLVLMLALLTAVLLAEAVTS
jgi:hypothetical protein